MSGFEPGQPGVHTLAEVATAAAANEQREAQVIQQQQQQQQEEQQQTATAIEINGEIAGTGDGNIIIAGEDGQGKESKSSSIEISFSITKLKIFPVRSIYPAYAVPVGSGGVILGSGGNVYQVVHQTPRPAETQTVQIISGSQLQAINGQIVTKAVQQQQQQQHEEEQTAESAEAATVTTSQQSGLTITPVSGTAAAAPSAARPQQVVAVSGGQPGQIIQVRFANTIFGCFYCLIAFMCRFIALHTLQLQHTK